MNHTSDFDLDLQLGQELEKQLEGILTGRVVAEVKRDFAAKRTGNIAIEYKSRGKPSGIAVTKSKYWIIGIENGAVIIAETEKVKAIARHYLKLYGDKPMGDNDTSRGILIPLNDYVRLICQSLPTDASSADSCSISSSLKELRSRLVQDVAHLDHLLNTLQKPASS